MIYQNLRERPLNRISLGPLFFFSDGGQPSTSAGNKRLQQTQAQVNEVVGIMRVNVEKVLERDQKLSELDQRVSNNNINLSGSSPINHRLSIDIPGGRPPARSLTVRTAGWQVEKETVVGERKDDDHHGSDRSGPPYHYHR